MDDRSERTIGGDANDSHGVASFCLGFLPFVIIVYHMKMKLSTIISRC
jgi:hypothetical protein